MTTKRDVGPELRDEGTGQGSRPRLPRKRPTGREWVRRLDRTIGDLNLLLVVFAIGLATLDLTILVTQQVVDWLPPMTRVVYVEKSRAPPDSPADHVSGPPAGSAAGL